MIEKRNAKTKRQQLIQEIIRRSLVVKVMQDCPWTAVHLELMELSDGGGIWNAYGFSKVCYPDEWDEDFGLNLAIEKAASKIAKKLIEHYGLEL